MTENPENKYVKVETLCGLSCVVLRIDEKLFTRLEKKAEKLAVIFKGIGNILSEKYTCIYAACGNDKYIILADKIIVCKTNGVIAVRKDPADKIKRMLINGTVSKYYREFEEIEAINKIITKRKVK
ncbi:MAG: hypothetical protein L0Y76_00130 [Ignavibacteria bacterium]|nr:hypothetical protein [Ignavibacteria bacterium]